MNYIQSSIDATGKPVKINYSDFGIGKPVILISGWPLSKEMWEYQIDDLVNSGHRVIAYDNLPNHGMVTITIPSLMI